MWVEDLEWIEDDEALDGTLGGVLVVFDEYGKVHTVREAALSPSCTPVGGGFRRIQPVSNPTR